MSGFANVLYVMLAFILAAAIGNIVWKAISARQVSVFMCMFLILPTGQLLTLYSLSFDEWTIFWLLGLALSLCAIVLLLIYANMQEKKAAAEEELKETRHRMELEKSHYEAVKQRREELDGIRRDFNKKLEAIAGLVCLGEKDKAREEISALAGEIAQTREKTYCAIPVINAVLTQKEKVCAQAGIRFEAELDIPAQLSVEPMHLCSILSNLMDNAVAACKQLEDVHPVIRLSSKVDGDYLFIKAANPSNEPPQNPLPGRGYGTRILTELAGRYGGNYHSKYSAGKFTAVISLLV